jgi:hypothetical protein
MPLKVLGHVMPSLLFITAFVGASPFSNSLGSLSARDLYVPIATTCDDIVYGAKNTKLGTVCVGIVDGILTVNYGTISPYKYSTVHVYVGTTRPTDRAPGSFPYASDKGTPPACTISTDGTVASCSIPVQPSWRQCGQTLFIATHASIVDGLTSDTAWGAGTCFGGTGGNCAKYWTFDVQCYCKTTSTYPPVTYTVSACLRFCSHTQRDNFINTSIVNFRNYHHVNLQQRIFDIYNSMKMRL